MIDFLTFSLHVYFGTAFEYRRGKANSWIQRGIVNTFGVYQTFYSTYLPPSITPSNISWIGSIQAYLLLVAGIATGPLYDAGYFRAIITTGSFLVVFGMMMTSICTEYWQIMLAQGICIGLGCGCLFVPSVAIVSTYFSTKKAFATGIAAAGSSLGTSLLHFHPVPARKVWLYKTSRRPPRESPLLTPKQEESSTQLSSTSWSPRLDSDGRRECWHSSCSAPSPSPSP